MGQIILRKANFFSTMEKKKKERKTGEIRMKPDRL